MQRVLITSSSEYRVKEPYSKLKIDGFEFTLCGQLIKDPFQYDAVLLHQPITKIFPEMIRDLQQDGKVVVVDVDDNILDIPYQNESFDQMNTNGNRATFLECIRLCDYIHVSTSELKHKLRYPNKTTIFNNGIDFSKYTFDTDEVKNKFYSEHNIPLSHKIVMWAGSPTHADSVILILPLIEELAKRGDVTVVLCSNERWMKSFFEAMPENVKIIGYLPFDLYTRLLSVADIFLVPLPNNKFNQCKSELKIIESAVYKTPCVASAVNPYLRFKQVSGNGIRIIAKERLNLWLKEVNELLTNSALYRTTGEQAYATTEAIYNLETINKSRKQWWTRILA